MEINNEIIEWIKKQNLHTMEPSRQLLKIVEEVGELSASMIRNNEDGIKDAIGDIYIALMTLTQQMNYNMDDCIKGSYNEIIDRKLKLVDGYYVKTEDIRTDKL